MYQESCLFKLHIPHQYYQQVSGNVFCSDSDSGMKSGERPGPLSFFSFLHLGYGQRHCPDPCLFLSHFTTCTTVKEETLSRLIMWKCEWTIRGSALMMCREAEVRQNPDFWHFRILMCSLFSWGQTLPYTGNSNLCFYLKCRIAVSRNTDIHDPHIPKAYPMLLKVRMDWIRALKSTIAFLSYIHTVKYSKSSEAKVI